jgi:hypothetical protein
MTGAVVVLGPDLVPIHRRVRPPGRDVRHRLRRARRRFWVVYDFDGFITHGESYPALVLGYV